MRIVTFQEWSLYLGKKRSMKYEINELFKN